MKQGLRMARARGAALFLVLVVTLILLLMLGAFVRVNRDHFSLVKSQSDRDTALRAARSVVQYCLFRLEHDKRWADEGGPTTDNQPFPRDRFDTGLDPRKMTVKEVGGTRTIEGEIPGLTATFRAEVLNNINDPAIDDGVRPGFARLLVLVQTSSGFSYDCEVMLRTAPFFDSAVITTGNIDISRDTRWEIGSKDPYRNQIRAMGQITGPRISFIDAGGEERATVWARGDIKLAGRSLSQDEMFLRQLEEDSGASFMPRARSYYDVPDLKIDDFKRSRNRVSLPAGLYVFTTAEVVWEAEVDGEIVTVAGTIPVLERRDTNLAIGEAGAGTIRELWYDKTVYESLAAGGAANIHFQDDGRDLKGQIPVHAVDPNGFLLAESGTSKKGTKAFMTASLAASSVSLYGDATVVVDGDFGVTAWNGSVPSLSLGDADGRTDTSTAVEAKGSISIYGPVTGTGKLLAAKTVVFAPTAATLEAEIDEEGEDTDVDVSRRAEGLAVYAGETVHLWTPDLNGSEAGLGYAPGAVSFKGLIYAKQGFGFDSADQPLYIEGALVAGNGGINANRAPVVQFVYNEEYVEDVLNDLPEDRIHLERFVWKE